MKFKDSFHPYAMATIFFWSLAYVLTRLALRHFSVFSLGFLRYFTASCALLPMGIAAGIKPPKRGDLKWFVAAGATGFFLYMVSFNSGCRTVSASTSSVVIAIVPVMTALFARLFYGERLYALQWAAIAVEFAGILVLTLMGGTFTVNGGVLWLLLAALSLSAYNLLQRKLTKTYSALQSSMYGIFAGTLMLAVFLPVSVVEVKNAPAAHLSYVLMLGVFSSALAYVSWAKAFSKAERTSYVSNYMFVTPFLTTLLGFLLTNELPDAPTLIGGAVILSGVALFTFGGVKKEFLSAAESGPVS